MRTMSRTRSCSGLAWSHRSCLLLLLLLLWTRRMSGLTDFSNYLSRIITNHHTHACDGQPLRLHCPRHSTISIQSAFYGSGAVRLCRADPHLGNQSCSAFTALQKLLSECQSHRHCQLPVSHLLFGEDPCPGSAKYLHVHYKCKPTEHKRHVVCEGETMALRCKPPRVLNIHAAVYGRSPEQTDTCPPHTDGPPPFECLNHEAVRRVTQACYSRQKCTISVDSQTFRDPCLPGTRKYLSLVYSCVPRTLLKEAELSWSAFTSFPPIDEGKEAPPTDLEKPVHKGSTKPENTGTMMSDSLQAYAFIKEHPERAALLFTSSVCIGLLLTLLAVSVRVTCRWGRCKNRLAEKPGIQNARRKLEDYDEDDSEDDDDDAEAVRSLISATERKSVNGWEEVTYRSEAAERAERIERREMIIQEIRMNAYLNGSAC